MGFFRSNKVLHLRIRMPNDIEGLMRIMDILGKTEIEALQFIDLTKEVPDSKKKLFINIKTCRANGNKDNTIYELCFRISN